ncbi:carbon-nitrogen hydrolase [Aureobasidium pullulans]|uniref:Carbon-nitrogen hydrolase n=1 Tax=Aureobasidium pullulans TaxID=5580 RepID=A0A4S9XBI5_AURPU|nr:carbon-nitrogen hydrolase [Aureobasidium pullulans]THW49734.1 carbon-nitrogen hydrolase [Aureobasidium pullulans]THZ76522.1 carbon-nitrogen hydrolase [Aureobasidium pullulans]THZ97489.1 carbon-nitrogen hydrolase [Aureobasidium pullulans]
MRIGCLQFAPKLGQVEENIRKADSLLEGTSASELDLLVLPEMAFSGYNFPNLEAITPFLEPSGTGSSSQWAKRTAARLDCTVSVGYPELTADGKRYNTVISISPDGTTAASYRKTFLYYTDETWALEGDTGFYNGELGALGQACMGICMDINPKKFEAPWSAYEFATHCVDAKTPLVVLSMAWLTRLLPQQLQETAMQPDLETLSYWLERFMPVVQSQREGGTVVVMANRCGTEPGAVAGVSQGVDDEGQEVVGYAGTSCVLMVDQGEVKIFDILGKAEERLLKIDTTEPPQFALRAKVSQ